MVTLVSTSNADSTCCKMLLPSTVYLLNALRLIQQSVNEIMKFASCTHAFEATNWIGNNNALCNGPITVDNSHENSASYKFAHKLVKTARCILEIYFGIM